MKTGAKRARQRPKVSQLWLGVSKQTINPSKGARLMGFPGERPCTGIDADLNVRILVFGSNRKPGAALVVIDNLYAPAPLVAAVRRRMAGKIPGLRPGAIMIAATHTHSAPCLRPYPSNREKEGTVSPDPAYRRQVIQAIITGMVEAWDKRRPVTARAGKGRAVCGHNRRVLVHGYARNEWQDPRRKHTGPFIPDIPFVVFNDTESGGIHALLAGYGCHPVTLGPGSTLASPDYPGYFTQALEEATGARTAVHIMTGAADINPLRCLASHSRLARALGRELAAAVLRAMPRAKPIPLRHPLTRTVKLRFRLRENLPAWVPVQIPGSDRQNSIETEVQSIILGNLAFVSAPGELFCQIASRIRVTSPITHTFIVEHANDAVGYIITDAATFEGGYEVCRGSLSESMERPYLSAAFRALAPKRE